MRQLMLAVLMLVASVSHAGVEGVIDVGYPALRVEVLSELNNNLDDLITIQAINSSSTTFVCFGRIGFFNLSTGSNSAFAVPGENRVPPGGPWVIVQAKNKFRSGLGNTLAYDSASCEPEAGAGGSGGGDPTAEVTLSGVIGYSIEPQNGLVTMRAESIRNRSSTQGTGTLRLELWALAGTWPGAKTGYQMGYSGLPLSCTDAAGRLGSGVGCGGVVLEANYTAPPPGDYVAVLFLTEYDPTCQASDKYCVVDYFNFTKPLIIETGGNVGGAGGGIELGSWRLSGNWGDGTVQLNVDKLRNSSRSRTSNTLRLELWATSTEYQGNDINGYRFFTSSLPDGCKQLAPNAECSGIGITGPVADRPPEGEYFLTLIVTEYSTGCTSADQYCIATSSNSTSKLSVPAQVTAPPPVVVDPVDSSSGGGGGGGRFDASTGILFLLLLTGGLHSRRRLLRNVKRDAGGSECGL